MNSAILKRPWASSLNGEQLKRQEAFYQVRIRHQKLTEVIDSMLPMLTPHNDSNIIFIVGATGVGKSTVSRIGLRKLYEARQEQMNADRSIIPFISAEAYTNGENRHTFRGIYEDLLEELHEPGMQKKKSFIQEDGRLRVKHDRGPTVRSLRKMLQKALNHRQTEVIVIDEAYHLLRFAKDTAVLDTFKSLANTCGAKIVLVGSYELFTLLDSQAHDSHAQVARRANVIHFERYHLEQPEDRGTFKTIIEALTAKWPCAEVPNFPAISDDLLELGLGCVGLVKSFLLDASAMQLLNGEKWDPRFMQRAAKSNKLREIIRKEIDAGEAALRDALYAQSLWDEKALARLTDRMGAPAHG